MKRLTFVTRMDVSRLVEELPDDVREAYRIEVYASPEVAGRELAEAEAVVTSGRLDSSVLELAPRLRWVQTLSAGVDKMPLAELASRGITLTNMRGIHPVQMSELAMSFMLQWVKRSAVWYEQQRTRTWSSKTMPDELYGKTVAS